MFFKLIVPILYCVQELGRVMNFTDVFDRTHGANKGKGWYKDNKSELVAVSHNIISQTLKNALLLCKYVVNAKLYNAL